MSTTFLIKSHFDYLQEQLNLLVEELSNADVIKASYFQLPKITKEDEQVSPTCIPVTKFEDKEALKHCLLAYKDMFIDDKASSRIMQRHPGILAINDPENSLLGRLNEVNRAKQQFKSTVLQINNNDARFEAVHAAVSSLITLAAYRKIHFETETPFSVRFTWMKKHSTKVLSKKSALNMLERSSNYSNPRVIDQMTWQKIVEQEKVRVYSLSEKSKLRIRRPTRVSPEVNVRYSAKDRYHVSAALPFILLNPSEETKLGDLKPYQLKEQTHPRSKGSDYLIDRLYLETFD